MFSNTEFDTNLKNDVNSLKWAKVLRKTTRMSDAEAKMLAYSFSFICPTAKAMHLSKAVLTVKEFLRQQIGSDLTITEEQAESGACKTELDALIAMQDLGNNDWSWPANNPIVSRGQIVNPYKCITACAGAFAIREISQTGKSWDELNRKMIHMLPCTWRPLHVLRLFANFDVLAKSLLNVDAQEMARKSG